MHRNGIYQKRSYGALTPLTTASECLLTVTSQRRQQESIYSSLYLNDDILEKGIYAPLYCNDDTRGVFLLTVIQYDAIKECLLTVIP